MRSPDSLVVSGGNVLTANGWLACDVFLDEGRIVSAGPDVGTSGTGGGRPGEPTEVGTAGAGAERAALRLFASNETVEVAGGEAPATRGVPSHVRRAPPGCRRVAGRSGLRRPPVQRRRRCGHHHRTRGPVGGGGGVAALGRHRLAPDRRDRAGGHPGPGPGGAAVRTAPRARRRATCRRAAGAPLRGAVPGPGAAGRPSGGAPAAAGSGAGRRRGLESAGRRGIGDARPRAAAGARCRGRSGRGRGGGVGGPLVRKRRAGHGRHRRRRHGW